MTLRLRVDRYRLPLGNSVRTARAGWNERAGLIITLQGNQGTFGQGEAAPLPGYSDDSLEQAEAALSRLDLGWLDALLEGAGGQPHSFLEALSAWPGHGVPSAHFALETAALDWLARRRNLPVHRLLRLALPTLTRDAPASLRLSALLGEADALADAETAFQSGFSCAKLKVGLAGRERDELAVIAALRARFPAAELRLDANGAWSSAEATARLADFAAFAIEFIEEPTAPGELPLVDPVVPVALDESLRRSPLPSRSELAARGVVALVLKPSVLGGIFRCLQLSAEARSLGCEPVLSHCFEGPIGHAALCELALAQGPTRLAQGLAAHPGLTNWGRPPASSSGRAELVPHHGAGLGLGSSPIEVPTPP